MWYVRCSTSLRRAWDMLPSDMADSWKSGYRRKSFWVPNRYGSGDPHGSIQSIFHVGKLISQSLAGFSAGPMMGCFNGIILNSLLSSCCAPQCFCWHCEYVSMSKLESEQGWKLYSPHKGKSTRAIYAKLADVQSLDVISFVVSPMINIERRPPETTPKPTFNGDFSLYFVAAATTIIMSSDCGKFVSWLKSRQTK